MLRACSIASGSRGNCLFVASNKASLLVDVGVDLKRLELSLRVVKSDIAKLDGVLITHTHSDHVLGLTTLCRKYGVPVYCHQVISEHVHSLVSKSVVVHSFGDDSFYIQDITVSPFLVQHDVHCVGYSLLSNTKQLSIATDIGMYNQGVLDAMSGSNLVFIESNYDEYMLHNGSYPAHLKHRVRSDFGHLSNTDCGSLVTKLTNMGTRQFVLSHLSQNNNYPELAFNTMVDTLGDNGIIEGKDVVVEVAEQHKLSSLFQL